MSTVLNPFTYIANPTTGRPVFNGMVYLGEPDTDPIQTVNQITVRVINEAGLLVPIAQPIRTGPGGIALNQGNPAQLDVVETQYSITIQNSQGTQVYYSPRVDIFGTIGDTLGNIEQFRTFGTPRYITSADNEGAPFPYTQYSRVVYDDGTGDQIYESRTNNNTRLPTVADDWFITDVSGNNARYLQVLNNLSDLNDVAVARQSLELIVGQNDTQIPRIGNPATDGLSSVVTNSGSNTNGNFRVYSDGLIIQFGTITTINSDFNEYPLPVSFSSIEYTVFTQLLSSTQPGPERNPRVSVLSVSSFTASPSPSSVIDFMWLAIGF